MRKRALGHASKQQACESSGAPSTHDNDVRPFARGSSQELPQGDAAPHDFLNGPSRSLQSPIV